MSQFKTAFDDVLKEIAIMRKLDHQNVMTLKDVIDDIAINKLYMVMDYCRDGAIMDSHLLPTNPLPPAKCRRWFADAVAGLDYLHFQEIVHFDLKPDNILIADDGRAVIADFGVSRLLNEAVQSEEEAPEGEGGLTSGSPGTPSYTAPEVWGHARYEAKRADVWALGVTLHAMVFGSLPFFSHDQQQLIEMVTHPSEWRCALPHDDRNLVCLLEGMLRKRPEERFSLEAVRRNTWVAREMEMRSYRLSVTHTKIQVTDAELRKAVISGHIENFRRTAHGTLQKTTSVSEAHTFQRLAGSSLRPFVPALIQVHALYLYVGSYLLRLQGDKAASGCANSSPPVWPHSPACACVRARVSVSIYVSHCVYVSCYVSVSYVSVYVCPHGYVCVSSRCAIRRAIAPSSRCRTSPLTSKAPA